MPISSKKTKKGQSIIEVMVAMTLITVVLGSTFYLVINAVNLVMLAQSRTEAIEIAQKGLAEAVLVLQDSCAINAGSDLSKIFTQVDAGNGTAKTLQVVMADAPSPLDTTFKKITATVTWNDRGAQNQQVVLTQYVRANTP